ncbi:UNVERIFIED_CONTAM: Meiotic recombination protein SPO11-1 [Sesamum calycinum]|uniref:DNA topoisomerase (ATP-hydrolyzing) n=1 Tax=Sesamum calycinum TaxID=2727403 RepID=A0AAW2Q5P4_9LAMI
MEGKHWSVNSYHLLKKIQELTRSIIEDVCNDRLPALYIDQFSSYCTGDSGSCCCSYDLAKGKEILMLRKESQARRWDVLLRVLLIVQQLLQENKHGSKRDIYYMHPSVFKEQCVVDRAINDICILLQCSRHNLNVVSVGNGVPKPILVDICFQGKGYPDVPTRRFLRLLTETLHLPVYCLVDCDPYGIDILTTYRFGSMQIAYDAKSLRIPEICWLGAFLSDHEKYQFPQQCLLPLTAEDKQKAGGLLNRCYMEREVPYWRSELQLMLDRGLKFEIEALSAHSLTFLSENYLPSKIQEGAYI